MTNENGFGNCDDIITHPKPSVCYSLLVYTAISFFTSASVISDWASHENETSVKFML